MKFSWRDLAGVGLYLVVWLVGSACAPLAATAQGTTQGTDEQTNQLNDGGVGLGAATHRGLGQPILVEAYRGRSPYFKCPAALRPRVDFWIDIFAKYGRYQSVIHHRHFPQAVFAVLDFSEDARHVSDVALKQRKDEAINELTQRIYAVLARLADGAAPTDEFEQRVYKTMQRVPGGPEKYRQTIDDQLVRSQTGIRERFGEAIRHAGRYMPMMEEVFVREHGLPVELTRLPFVESSFDYTAYSSVGAAGIWQFMPTTGRLFLTVNGVVDERRDPVLATQAAAQYLKMGFRQLGSWPLALTGYNHGTGGVARKVEQYGTSDIAELVEHPTERVFGFASSNFYPEFLAAVEVYENRSFYFPEIEPEPPLRYIEHEVTHPLTLRYVTQQLNVSQELLQEYNYAPSKLVWEGGYPFPVGYKLRVPVEARDRVSLLFAPDPSAVNRRIPPSSSIYGGVTYRVRKGDTLAKIAKKYGTSPKSIKALNGLKSESVPVGKILVVKAASVKREAAYGNDNAQVNTSTPHHIEATYTVRKKDSIESIAKRFGMTSTEVKALNGLQGSKLRVGQTLRVKSVNEPAPTTPPQPSDSKGGSGPALKGSPQKKESKKKESSTYVVRSGDTLSSIAKKSGISVDQLKKANRLKGSNVKPGAKLNIP